MADTPRFLFDARGGNDGDRLLRAVLDEPEETSPRLVYADWLEERGDPRSELIRAQCRLEDLPAFDARRVDLERRERELLDSEGQLWAGPVHNVATSYEFRRGFVERVACGAMKYVSQGHRMYELHPVSQLRLTRLGSSSLRGRDLAKCSLMRHVRGLELVGTLSAEDLSLWLSSAHLRRLRRLRVEGMGFSWDSLAPALSEHSELAELDIQYLQLPSDGRLVLPSFLSKLSIHGGGWRADSVRRLGETPPLEHLTHLTLREQRLNVAGGQVLALFPCRRLRSLDLTGDLIRGGGTQALAGSKILETVEELNLSSNSVGLRGYEALAQSPHLENLRVIRLERNMLREVDFARLLQAAPKLQSLSLRGNELNDADVSRLASCPAAKQLRHLDLSYNSCGARGVLELAHSPHLSELQSLSLDHWLLEGPSIHGLLESTSLSNLRQLSVRYARLRKRDLRFMLKANVQVPLDKLRMGLLDGDLMKELADRFGARVVP